MMAFSPRARAVRAYSNMRSGVRCALTTVSSCSTWNSLSVSAASRITSRSLRLPMMIPIMSVWVLWSRSVWSAPRAREGG